MINRTLISAVVIGAGAILAGSAVAVANPGTPMPVIDAAAAELCGAVNTNPTEDGVLVGLSALEDNRLDEMDGALVFITAIHHVCPQHESLMMKVLDPIAAEELCSKPT